MVFQKRYCSIVADSDLNELALLKLKDIENATTIVIFWINRLLHILMRDGKIYQYTSIVENFLIKITDFCSINAIDLKSFFDGIYENMVLPLVFRKRVVAGRKILIPVALAKDKEINYIIRMIIKSLKYRTEKRLIDRLSAEFIDVYNGEGHAIKYRLQYFNELMENIPNLRFLTH